MKSASNADILRALEGLQARRRADDDAAQVTNAHLLGAIAEVKARFDGFKDLVDKSEEHIKERLDERFDTIVDRLDKQDEKLEKVAADAINAKEIATEARNLATRAGGLSGAGTAGLVSGAIEFLKMLFLSH